MLDFGSGIPWTTGTAASLKHLIIGNIVSHVQDILVLNAILLQQPLVGFYLVATAKVYILTAKGLVPAPDRLVRATCNNGDWHTQLQGKMYGISILYIGSTHRLPILAYGNGGGTEHTVDIEGQELYLTEVVVYHCRWLLNSLYVKNVWIR